VTSSLAAVQLTLLHSQSTVLLGCITQSVTVIPQFTIALYTSLAIQCDTAQVDIDENRDAAKDAGIMSVPTFMFYKNGTMISKVNLLTTCFVISYISYCNADMNVNIS
jgi:Thioredoxin